MFDLNLLRVFVLLMEERSVSRAADRLGLTQSATSNALARLRDAMGDALFVRQGNAMVPTPAALSFYEHAEAGLEEIRRGFESAAAFDPTIWDGQLRIGLDAYALHLFGAELLEAIRGAAPQVLVCVLGVTPHDFDAALLDGRLDYAISQTWRERAQIKSEHLVTEDFVALVRRGHPFTDAPVTLEAYLEVDHILFSEAGRVRRNVDFSLERIGRRRRVRLTLPSFPVAAEVLRGSNNVFNIGRRMGERLASRHDLSVIELPIAVDGFDIAFQSAGHRANSRQSEWLRELVSSVVPR
ncbi:MAG: LysR family transcriptional regulator [Pseudomonadota bacterium]